MHIRSTDKQFATLKAGDATEKHKQELLEYIKQEESHVVFVEDRLIDPTNEVKQLGRAMTSQEFEQRLRKILPSNCVFIDNPFNPTKRAIIRLTSINESETLVPYEKGWTPEHSVMQLVEKEIPDPEVLARRKSISRKDMPKSEYIQGEGFRFDDTVTRPGFKRIKQIGREIKRGWRTVLIKLCMSNVITVTDAERIFAPDNSPGWHQNLKGQTAHVPW